jgi:hypothetical protein
MRERVLISRSEFVCVLIGTLSIEGYVDSIFVYSSVFQTRRNETETIDLKGLILLGL